MELFYGLRCAWRHQRIAEPTERAHQTRTNRSNDRRLYRTPLRHLLNRISKAGTGHWLSREVECEVVRRGSALASVTLISMTACSQTYWVQRPEIIGASVRTVRTIFGALGSVCSLSPSQSGAVSAMFEFVAGFGDAFV